MTKRVLITGGFGYLGGRIALELREEPDVVVRLGSRKPQSAPDWLPEAETAAMDVLQPETVARVVSGVQAVVHLAAMNENECASDPAKAFSVNTIGTLNVLQAAIDEGVERFLYFSTAHVYRAPLVGHITEKTLPRPVHPYAITHHAAEDLVLAAHDDGTITGIVIRLSNGFGAAAHSNVDRWTLLVNDLCRQAVQAGRMVLRSNGLQRRNFVTLQDVGRAVSHLLNLSPAACGDGLYNFGGPSSLPIWEMAQKIGQRCQLVLGFTPEIERSHAAYRERADALSYDSNKIRRTGFSWSGSTDNEIDSTLNLCAQMWGSAQR